ncbi:MAG: HEAT repeat domain-containing protein, partial [Pseudomonas neustonica]
LFNDGGLQDVLQLASDPEQRMAALLATKRMPGNEAAPILKLALRDPEDDVRLLAYSMLDQQETAINQNIERLQLRLADNPLSPKATHAALARWYWELAYLGLAQGGVLEHILAQALLHTQAAMEGSDNADLDLLAGRILMAQGQTEEAGERLQHAVDLGANPSRVAPFLAEIAFMEQRYSEVSLHLQAIPEALLNKPPLATAARYWL